MTYLTITNEVLNELNEVEITDVTGAVGFQKFVVEAVNKAIGDIYNEEYQWPFSHTDGSQATTAGQQEYDFPSDYRQMNWDSFILRPTDLVTNGAFTSDISSWSDVSTGTGSVAYTSDGNGRMRLAGGASGVGAAEQSLSTTKNTEYRIKFRTFTGDIDLKVGTSSGAVDLLAATTYSVTNTGNGAFHTVTFSATGTTTFVGFYNSANANHDVDLVEVHENMDPKSLAYLNYEEWHRTTRGNELLMDPDSYGLPDKVYRTRDEKFGLSTIPDSNSYTVLYDYWATYTDMSVNGSTHSIPVRYEWIIKERVLMYAYRFRQDMDAARDAEKKYEHGVMLMRADLINKQDEMISRTKTRRRRRAIGF